MNASRFAGLALIAALILLAFVTELDGSLSHLSWILAVAALILGGALAISIRHADRRWQIGSRLEGRRALWAGMAFVIIAATTVPMMLERVSTQSVITILAFISGTIITLPLLYMRRRES